MSLKEGTDFVIREGNYRSYELKAFIAFLLSRQLFEGNPHEKILSRHFPLVVKLTRGQSFTLASYSLGTLYSHLDHFTLDLQRSWGRFQVNANQFLIEKKSYLHLMKMQISFLIKKDLDLHLMKMQINFFNENKI